MKSDLHLLNQGFLLISLLLISGLFSCDHEEKEGQYFESRLGALKNAPLNDAQ